MNRFLVFVMAVAGIGLGFAAASVPPVPVKSGGDHNRLGRPAFAVAQTSGDAGADVSTGEAAGADPAAGASAASADASSSSPDPAATEPSAAGPADPAGPADAAGPADPSAAEAAASAAAAAPVEPDVVSVRTVTLSVVENSFLPPFKVKGAIRLELDMEGLIYWVTSTKRTEMNSQNHVFNNIGAVQYRDFPLIIVPDEFTNWQYVKDLLATADRAATPEVYLGVADTENTKTLRLLHVLPSAPSDTANEGDFVIHVAEGDGGPDVQVDGEDVAFPDGLIAAWEQWKAAHAGADTSFGPSSPVVLDAHRFTPSGYVARVIGVLRGLGIECERFTGATTYGGRKRK